MDMLLNVNTANLLKLADFLETVPPEDFSLTEWQTNAPKDAIRLGPIVFRAGCGFAGCAVGWAAYSNIFDGLRLNREAGPVYRGARGISAVENLFGITTRMSEYLFWEVSYPNHDPIDPADVSARIRKLVRKIEARIARKSGREWIKCVTHKDATISPGGAIPIEPSALSNYRRKYFATLTD